MRSQSHHNHAIERGMIVPAGEIEVYLSLGWQLADEPGCGAVSMSPPNASHRVPHKKTGRSGHCEPVRNDFDNARDSRALRVAQ